LLPSKPQTVSFDTH
ncbi:hypothetical protein KIPB_017172, partial [Kipferlia bialata]